jgi:hypothetical protein
MIIKTMTPAHAIRKLFEHSQDSLSIESLEWLGNISEAAELEADNIAATLNILALLFSNADKGNLPDAHSMAMMLDGFGDRLDMVSNLINISGEARFTADRKRAELVHGGAA